MGGGGAQRRQGKKNDKKSLLFFFAPGCLSFSFFCVQKKLPRSAFLAPRKKFLRNIAMSPFVSGPVHYSYSHTAVPVLRTSTKARMRQNEAELSLPNGAELRLPSPVTNNTYIIRGFNVRPYSQHSKYCKTRWTSRATANHTLQVMEKYMQYNTAMNDTLLNATFRLDSTAHSSPTGGMQLVAQSILLSPAATPAFARLAQGLPTCTNLN